MLDRLLETGARRRKSAWGGTASVIVHGAIIGLVIFRTATAGPAVRIVERFVPIVPFRPAAPSQSAAGSVRGGNPTDQGKPTVALPPTAVPGPVDIDIPSLPTTGGLAGDTTLLADIGRSGGGAVVTGSGGGAVSGETVDTPVRVLSERVPAYPETLRSAGIAGTVTMQFVIDTIGRVEPSSLRVLATSHELFTRAVVTSLRQARFTPGEVAGRRVRTLVERSFRFDLAGAR